MPELPEVETVCRGLASILPGHHFVHVSLFRKDLRIPFPENLPAAIENKKIIRISRRAKYILIFFEDTTILIVHLGMSGSIRIYSLKRNLIDKHDHVIFDLADGKEIVFNDPRRFGLITFTHEQALNDHPLITSLGPEPLEQHFTADYLANALANKKVAIKTALMDNHIVVGIGNIYACESLFKVGILPDRPANQIRKAELKKLVPAAQCVLDEAIKSGGSTLRNYVQSSGESGYFQHRFFVYGREGKPCFICQTPIKRIVQGGRSTFYCKTCQK